MSSLFFVLRRFLIFAAALSFSCRRGRHMRGGKAAYILPDTVAGGRHDKYNT